MKMLQETTNWGEHKVQNHTYLLEGDRCVGYIKQGSTKREMFSKPMRFDKRGRTFQEIRG